MLKFFILTPSYIKRKKNKPTYAASYKTQLDRESGEWP